MTLRIREHADRYLFRSAAPAPVWRNVAKTLVQIVAFWGVLLWVFPLLILRVVSEYQLPGVHVAAWPVAGWTLLLLASAAGFWSGLTMAWHGLGTPLPLDHANRLVVRGPYAFICNPMAFTGLTQGTAVALITGSTAVFLYVVAGGSFWNWVVRPFEERDLVRRFAEPYERYRRAVRCWVPRLTPYRD
ncbi:MAG TPA: methyltransferase [Vicinamibacterales bacterium]|nr:methyltransferase [Vicinamibacterales bacterium]